MATGPKLAASPLELLTNDGSREAPFFHKYWGPGLGGTLGLLTVVISNFALRRPLLSGIHQHGIGIVLGAAIGKYVDDYRNDYLAERDAVLRHYIQLHPEDFPDYDRKKYGEVLESWVPVR